MYALGRRRKVWLPLHAGEGCTCRNMNISEMPGGPWLLTNTGGQSHIHQLFSTSRAGSGCCTAADTDVADGCLAGIATRAAVASTGRLVQPAHGGSVAAPICDAQRHAGCHRVAHAIKVAAALGVIKDHLLPVLLEPGDHPCATCDRRAYIGSQGVANVERRVHIKRSCGVDPIAATRTVCLAVHVPCVLPTAVAVASGVVPLVGGRIALVRSGGEHSVVGLHDVHLRTPLPADHVGVTVVRAPGAAPGTGDPAPIQRWLLDKVEREIASTTDTAKVHSEAQGPAEELEPSKAVRVPRPGARGGDADAGVVLQSQSVLGDHGASTRHEGCCVQTLNGQPTNA
mmetsp:Transcript_59631/g.184872  ORF Transcript_59631/g.184872 Transcript_59631/m.184872 type:complete len:342 (+) Transcript_59631:184-1209(+)